MGRIKLPIPKSGGLILSYQCTAEYRYCMYACSPEWRDWISEEDIERILRQLAGKITPSPYGPDGVSLNHCLHFTGGEPFLNFEPLLKAVFEVIDDYQITIYELKWELASKVIEIAMRKGLTIYDSAYVTLAYKLDATLYTGDEKLQKKVQDSNYVKRISSYMVKP